MLDKCPCHLAGVSPAPGVARQGVSDLDLRRALDRQWTNARSSHEGAVVRSPRPESEAVAIPMGEIGRQIGFGGLGRARSAQIARDLGIEVEGDEIGQMAFVQPLGDQSRCRETVHRAASLASSRAARGHGLTKEPDLSTGEPRSSRVSDTEGVSDGLRSDGRDSNLPAGRNG